MVEVNAAAKPVVNKLGYTNGAALNVYACPKMSVLENMSLDWSIFRLTGDGSH